MGKAALKKVVKGTSASTSAARNAKASSGKPPPMQAGKSNGKSSAGKGAISKAEKTPPAKANASKPVIGAKLAAKSAATKAVPKKMATFKTPASKSASVAAATPKIAESKGAVSAVPKVVPPKVAAPKAVVAKSSATNVAPVNGTAAKVDTTKPRPPAAPLSARSKAAAAALAARPPIKTVVVMPAPRKDGSPIRLQKPTRIEPPKPIRPDVPTMSMMEPVSSSADSKPKKNQAGFSPKELEQFRDLLLEKRRELVGDMNSMEREALQSNETNLSTLPIHMADMGTDNYEQEFTLVLVEKDRVLLREINHALAKIQNGAYGICEGNGKPITKVRLEAQPWARHSIDFARMQEKRGIR